MATTTDVLAALEPHRDNPLYPRACVAVLLEKRTCGAQAAIRLAEDIAGRMEDVALERKIR
jgi:hypothetical protein